MLARVQFEDIPRIEEYWAAQDPVSRRRNPSVFAGKKGKQLAWNSTFDVIDNITFTDGQTWAPVLDYGCREKGYVYQEIERVMKKDRLSKWATTLTPKRRRERSIEHVWCSVCMSWNDAIFRPAKAFWSGAQDLIERRVFCTSWILRRTVSVFQEVSDPAYKDYSLARSLITVLWRVHCITDLRKLLLDFGCVSGHW